MDASRDLQHDRRWRTAVWSLRIGYVGLFVAIVGLIVTLAGGTPWILAAGMIVWLVNVVVILIGFFSARSAMAEPRPTLWSMRMALLADSWHARQS